MTNLQLDITLALPTLAVPTSLAVSLVQISAIREDIREIRSGIKLLTGKVYEMMPRNPETRKSPPH